MDQVILRAMEAYDVNIPFTPNRGQRCVPACTKMVLDLLAPERHITENQAEQLSGFREGYATWAAQHLLSLSNLGIEVGWIQDEDLPEFAQNPKEFYYESGWQ